MSSEDETSQPLNCHLSPQLIAIWSSVSPLGHSESSLDAFPLNDAPALF